MSWARLDDSFDENPKQLSLSDGAFRVWVCSFSYCARQNPITGFMTVLQAQGLARKLRKPIRVIDELLSLRAWELADGGYVVHDYDQYVDRGSVERVRRHRAAKRFRNEEETNGNVTETAEPVTGNVTVTGFSRFRNPSRVRAPDGYPVPEPVDNPPPVDTLPSVAPQPAPPGGLNGRFGEEYKAFVTQLSQAVGRRFRGDVVSQKLYAQRRRDGRSAEELQAAARGIALSPHHMGLNDNGTPYNGPASVLRSKMLDTLIGLGSGEVGLVRRETTEEQRQREIREWAVRADAEGQA